MYIVYLFSACDMVAGSILPVTIYKGKLHFLFGKENPMEDSSKGWSDFGGRMDTGETPFTAALREGGEELTGFLGDDKDIRRKIKEAGGVYKISHNDYHVHMFYMDYDENLPRYYNANHRFLWERMDKQMLNDTKLFEKIEIAWFSIDDLMTRRSEFRGFYREIIDLFINDSSKIRSFILSLPLKNSKRSNKKRKTLKNVNS